MYDLVAGIQSLKSSYMLSKSRALELFPMLKKDKLVGAIVYYDGQSSVSCQPRSRDHTKRNVHFSPSDVML